VIVTHKSSIQYLAICKAPIRSLISACFNGIVIVHELEDEGSFLPECPRSSKCFNLQFPRLYSIRSNQNYFVANNFGGSLPIFWLQPSRRSTTLCEDKRKAPIEVVRTLNTGLSTVNSVTALPNGLVVVGHKSDGKRHLLYYDFEIDSRTYTVQLFGSNRVTVIR
jgi:hypothetical protein